MQARAERSTNLRVVAGERWGKSFTMRSGHPPKSTPVENDILTRLTADGYDLDISEPEMDVEATVQKLKDAGLEMERLRLPAKGTAARKRRVLAICEKRGISPVWRRVSG